MTAGGESPLRHLINNPMRRFVHWLNETNTTALFSYGKDFQVDQARGDWDVEDYDTDGDERKKFKPWEIENALNAEKRRNDILRWARAGFLGLEEVVTDKSVPLVPKWQTEKR